MTELWQWATANPVEALSLGYAILNALNVLLRPRAGWAGGVLDKARVVLDRVAVVQAGSVPFVKPGFKSRERGNR